LNAPVGALPLLFIKKYIIECLAALYLNEVEGCKKHGLDMISGPLGMDNVFLPVAN